MESEEGTAFESLPRRRRVATGLFGLTPYGRLARRVSNGCERVHRPPDSVQDVCLSAEQELVNVADHKGVSRYQSRATQGPRLDHSKLRFFS